MDAPALGPAKTGCSRVMPEGDAASRADRAPNRDLSRLGTLPTSRPAAGAARQQPRRPHELGIPARHPPRVFGSESQTANLCVCDLMLRRPGNLCFSRKNTIVGAIPASDRQDLGGLNFSLKNAVSSPAAPESKKPDRTWFSTGPPSWRVAASRPAGLLWPGYTRTSACAPGGFEPSPTLRLMPPVRVRDRRRSSEKAAGVDSGVNSGVDWNVDAPAGSHPGPPCRSP
jgi:hypothetical protein